MCSTRGSHGRAARPSPPRTPLPWAGRGRGPGRAWDRGPARAAHPRRRGAPPRADRPSAPVWAAGAARAWVQAPAPAPAPAPEAAEARPSAPASVRAWAEAAAPAGALPWARASAPAPEGGSAFVSGFGSGCGTGFAGSPGSAPFVAGSAGLRTVSGVAALLGPRRGPLRPLFGRLLRRVLGNGRLVAGLLLFGLAATRREHGDDNDQQQRDDSDANDHQRLGPARERRVHVVGRIAVAQRLRPR